MTGLLLGPSLMGRHFYWGFTQRQNNRLPSIEAYPIILAVLKQDLALM